MENIELNRIEKIISKIEFDQDPLSNLISQIDEIYIILDEIRHVNIYNERLSAIKSELAKAIETEKDAFRRREVFSIAKREVLALLNEISELH